MTLAQGMNKGLSFREKAEGHRMTDRHSISLHREAIITGFLAEVQPALSPKHRHTRLASSAFHTARTRISGSNEKNKEDIKVTRKILNQPIRLSAMWELFNCISCQAQPHHSSTCFSVLPVIMLPELWKLNGHHGKSFVLPSFPLKLMSFCFHLKVLNLIKVIDT